MNALKKMMLAPIALIAIAAALPAVAAPIDHTIKLSAYVPTADFYVLPTQNNWIGDVQTLNYNVGTGDLSTVLKQFSVINTASAINGRLAGPATLTSGGDSIALNVNFAGKTLTTTMQEVVSKPLAATKREVNLEIAAIKPTPGYTAGNYTGLVQLEFDAAP
jgi:hypothetical protein